MLRADLESHGVPRGSTETERAICRPDLCMKEDVALILHVKWTIAMEGDGDMREWQRGTRVI